MLSKKVAVAIAVVLAIICLAEAREEGPHDMADAIRMLQELDRLYTQAARPRIDRRDVADAGSMDPHSLDRAVRLVQLWKLDNMYSYKTRPRIVRRSADIMDRNSLEYMRALVQLQQLDDIYSYKKRPRFGKRSDTYSNWAKDVEKPDLPAWLAYARRR
ncbi:uncharacterized protein LOC106133085 isoform X1 [Amyelois transitella]|uniref:uncharacterized protein LOC106133085 isoform X1 n=1 Tax=Amyelois transitella TaxID=680683 RepID=UPI00298F6937|nr:uncharacterized protein LOC106133085 isoform X1 [Amyelois transitella]